MIEFFKARLKSKNVISPVFQCQVFEQCLIVVWFSRYVHAVIVGGGGGRCDVLFNIIVSTIIIDICFERVSDAI